MDDMLPGMPTPVVRRDADEAAELRRLQAQVPLHLPGDAAAAEGSALGAQHGRRRGARDARRLLALAGRRRRTPVEAVSQAARRAGGTRASATRRSRLDWRDRSADMVLALPARLRPVLRAARSGAHGRLHHRAGAACAVGWTGSTSAPARDGSGGTELAIVDYKTGRRPLTATDARSSLAMALYVLGARRVLHRAVHPGRAAPPADQHHRGGRPRRRRPSPATSAGPSRSPTTRPPPRPAGTRASPRPRPTRSSHPSRHRSAAGATSPASALKAAA